MITFEVAPLTDGPITLEEHNYRKAEDRRLANIRPHCSRCGRYMPRRSLGLAGSSVTYETWETGECPTHGRVEVSWPEA